ncbi:hypothetical protein TSAR_014261 [Trichomalopsis sarcophagae]|uniref:PCAF N-terminal domain-containing protein n=1 Tax=Trichomalopsis sarcophagae TaxID=543379 RepID=A0A232EXT0_9HYME|nr:hypothetical protein TSAR_014261 [Trichomalopsis sarcophagae]
MKNASTCVKLNDEQVKLLVKVANYGTCDFGHCHCDSWKSRWPLLEMLKTRDELFKALRQACLECRHDIKSHISKFLLTSANMKIKITENNVYLFTQSLQEATQEHVNFILFRLLRKSFMSALRMSDNDECQQPPFESPTIHEALETFVKTRFPGRDNFSHQLMANSAKIFGDMLNELVLDPSDVHIKHSSVDDATFRLFYGRWFLWCYPDNRPGAPPHRDVTKTMGKTWLKMAFPIFLSKLHARKSFADKLPGAKRIPYLDCYIKFLTALECEIYAKRSTMWKKVPDWSLKSATVPTPAFSKDSKREIAFFGTVEEPLVPEPQGADEIFDYDMKCIIALLTSLLISAVLCIFITLINI